MIWFSVSLSFLSQKVVRVYYKYSKNRKDYPYPVLELILYIDFWRKKDLLFSFYKFLETEGYSYTSPTLFFSQNTRLPPEYYNYWVSKKKGKRKQNRAEPRQKQTLNKKREKGKEKQKWKMKINNKHTDIASELAPGQKDNRAGPTRGRGKRQGHVADNDCT